LAVIAEKMSPIKLVPFAIALLVVGFSSPPPAIAQPILDNPGPRPEHSFFSPVSSVGILDDVRFFYTLSGESAWVRVDVLPGSEDDTTGTAIRTLLLDEFRATGHDTLLWDGRDSLGAVVADGFYWFVVRAWSDNGTDTEKDKTYLDNETPLVSDTVSVINPYAPDHPDRDRLARVTVNVSNIGNSDKLEVRFQGPGGLGVVLDSVSVDSSYTLAWDGSGFSEGVYTVRVRAFDLAGNSDELSAPSLRLDRNPPVGEIFSPTRSDTNGYIRRISLEATDRISGLEEVLVTLVDGDDTTRTVAVDSLFSDPYPITGIIDIGIDTTVTDSTHVVAWTQRLAVRVYIRDRSGYETVFADTFKVDTVSPPVPTINPLQTPVPRPTLSYEGNASEAEKVFVFLDLGKPNGGLLDSHTVDNEDTFRSSRSLFTQGVPGLTPGLHTLRASSRDVAGNESELGPAVSWSYAPDFGVSIPERFRLNDPIKVDPDVPARGVTVHILTLRGRRVRTLKDTESKPFYDIEWNLNDSDGNPVGSGPYLFHVVVDLGEESKLEKRLIAVVTR
jgi:flagellar hook assembly protein FlgD